MTKARWKPGTKKKNVYILENDFFGFEILHLLVNCPFSFIWLAKFCHLYEIPFTFTFKHIFKHSFACVFTCYFTHFLTHTFAPSSICFFPKHLGKKHSYEVVLHAAGKSRMWVTVRCW